MRSGIVINAVVAVIAAAAGYAIYTNTFASREEPPATIAESSAAPADAEVAAGAIPQELPDFTLADRDGNQRSIRSWTDQSMIVNFWATWCAPCRREIPLLKELQQTHAAAGFQVVGVAVDFREDVLKYATDMKINYPLLIGEQDGMDAVTRFGMGSIGFPFTVFTDKRHRIVATHLGELTRAQSEVVIAAIERVNSGELTPAAARAVVAKQLAALPSVARS